MDKKYKHERIIKAFSIIGGFIGFFYRFFYLFNIDNINTWIQIFGYYEIISSMLGMIIAGITLLTSINPNNPLPLHWLSLMLLGALMLIFAYILGGIFVLIASIICLVDAKKINEKDIY
ncbi:MAG: hypothetical protein ACFE8E_14300 [Candidatus Hodarchaeota archaeon]